MKVKPISCGKWVRVNFKEGKALYSYESERFKTADIYFQGFIYRLIIDKNIVKGEQGWMSCYRVDTKQEAN